MRPLPLILCGLAAPLAAQAQQEAQHEMLPIEYHIPELVQELNLRCKPPLSPLLESALLSTGDCSYNNTTTTSEYDPTYALDIPVVVHVIQRSNGTGALSNAQVESQIEILNEDFRAMLGTPGAPGTDAMIQFHLATEDPMGNPTDGITNSTNNNWYDDNGSYWNTLAWDTNRYLNIYTNSASGFLGYVPSLPQGGSIVGTAADRVVCYWASFGRNAPFAPYDQGRTATHEVGHYLGLFHTFDFGCDGGACNGSNSGDRVCDTNEESGPVFGCPGSSFSCGSADPFRNYMDYSDDLCMNKFTADQGNRMRCTILNWRPNLASACASVASVTTRSAGTNPNSYTVTTPVIGGPTVFDVDLTATAHTTSYVFGFAGPLDITLGGGQRLLSDITHFAGDQLALGASVTGDYFIFIPDDIALCGLTIYSQAMHYGGIAPFALSNAQDLVVGN